MAERNPPAWLQSGSHPADLDRQLLETLIPVAGIVTPGALAVTEQATPAMGVTVAAGTIVIDGTEAAAQGVYHAVNDAPVDLAVAASDPTNPRVDLVIARVRDAFYSGATNAWALEIVTGTPAATPAEPAVPDNAHVLARIDVPASASSITNANLTDRRTQAGFRAAGLRQIVTYAASGTFDKADYPWARKVRVRVQGGGGGGGGTAATAASEAATAAGGGGGAYAEKLLDVADLAASETVTVGAGGAGGAAGNNSGAAGGTSSFGAHASADGGGGGDGSTNTAGSIVRTPGLGGASGVGDLVTQGGDGGFGVSIAVSGGSQRTNSGFGGGSGIGGGTSRPAFNGVGTAGDQYGGGGSGACVAGSQPAAAGGDGADGVVIVELYG